MTPVLAIICGVAIIAALFAIPGRVMVLDLGWKGALRVWTIGVLATAIVVGASLLIGYGVDRL